MPMVARCQRNLPLEWRDKFINGDHVWLRRSTYVAREFAWLSLERQDLVHLGSLLAGRLLPTKWKFSGYVLWAIDIADAVLENELTQVTCELATVGRLDYALGRVLFDQWNGSQMWCEALEPQTNSFPAYPPVLRPSVGATARRWCFAPSHQK